MTSPLICPLLGVNIFCKVLFDGMKMEFPCFMCLRPLAMMHMSSSVYWTLAWISLQLVPWPLFCDVFHLFLCKMTLHYIKGISFSAYILQIFLQFVTWLLILFMIGLMHAGFD